MKEHIIYKYEAFDGTMFDDAFACRDYEIREQAKTSSVVLLDEKWEELPINTDSISRCSAIICNSAEDIQFVKDIFTTKNENQLKHKPNVLLMILFVCGQA